jgi:hypothetical protein
MLSQPQETLELQHKQAKPVAVTCLAFPHGDVNNFIVGSEEGSVYTGEKTTFLYTTASFSELVVALKTPQLLLKSLLNRGLCGLVARLPGYRSRGLGSVFGATRF